MNSTRLKDFNLLVCSFSVLTGLPACTGDIGNDPANSGAAVYDVSFESSDGETHVLGQYFPDEQKFYQVSDLDLEAEVLVIETDDGSLSIFPQMEEGWSNAKLDLGASYSVHTYLDPATPEDPLDRTGQTVVELGVASVAAEPSYVDQGIAAYKTATWGVADYHCYLQGNGYNCHFYVRDIKEDGQCVSGNAGGVAAVACTYQAAGSGRFYPSRLLQLYVTNNLRYFTLWPSI